MRFSSAAAILALACPPLLAAPTFLSGVSADGGWYDVNKKTKFSLSTPYNPPQYYTGVNGFYMYAVDDTKQCWAAAASNTLQWWQDRKGSIPAGLPNGIAATHQYMPYMAHLQIYQTMINSWTNAGGTVEQAWNWWFNGGNLYSDSPASIKDYSTGGYWKELGFTVNEATGTSSLFTSYTWPYDEPLTLADCAATLTSYIDNDWGTTLSIHGSEGAHAITMWGYDYDAAGNLILFLTDSDDNQHGMFAKQLTLTTTVTDAGVTNNLLGLADPENYSAYTNKTTAPDYTDSILYTAHALTAPYKEGDAVPEPTASAMVLLSLLGLARRRRR